MKFAVKSCGNGRARTGVFQLGNVVIDTPALLISTRKGLPHFVSPDLLLSLHSPDHPPLLQFSPLHFIEGISAKTISAIGGLHQMLGLHEYGLVALPRDSIACIPQHKTTNKAGAAFETPSGRRLVLIHSSFPWLCLVLNSSKCIVNVKITPSDYMEMISCMKPTLWTSLADEVPSWVSDKRHRTSVDRTVNWLDTCLKLSPVTQSSEAVFGSIVGGSVAKERQRCAEEVGRRNVAGFWIGGFGLGESVDERTTLLNAIMENLPEEKPRLVSGLDLPEEILEGIAAGVDLFDSSYIYHLIQGGFALTFPLDGTKKIMDMDSDSDSDNGIDPIKINLKATKYRKDTTPIVEGCSCYTCKNHTKAYLNHLLNVHEMLVQTLLEIHNTHHYLGFFSGVREAIKEGKFDQFRQKFVCQRRAHIG